MDDFDFFIGAWLVSHRRLKARLAGCTDWEAFDGACTTQKILGGLGNMDDNVLNLPGGAYRAVTLRAFDPQTGTWAIWWLDGRTPHALDVPMIGVFRDGVGTFHADDTFAGRPIRVRFLWTRTREASPQWEQAFSIDGGESWETNWTMQFNRT
ncbi:MAG: DUF1579 domain-containing protein [Hyphomonadaceae bacterium]|nr:MAG: hypothetical protein FD160_751 [Caulobacteraceae bacterium]MBT9444216.1 DUF1579 domain-containing protein [Hyphomonadaceae bacterium]TPW06526.1 MAG: hypothetical protein FD124_1703 [Alphaproteobacteria bacterium]